jgi:hypothetical protein
MFTFDQVKRAVEEMEQGKFPPPDISNSDRIAAIKSLLDQVCSAPWTTAEEREKAQGLVSRLERLKYSLQKRARQE